MYQLCKRKSKVKKLLCLIFILLLSIAVFAIVYNKNNSNNNNKECTSNGDYIGESLESNGIKLTLDTALIDDNKVILLYILTDKTKNIIKDLVSLDKCHLYINGSSNYGKCNSSSKNGSSNYIIFYNDKLREKKIANLEFVVESLCLTNQSEQYIISLDKKGDFLDKSLDIQVENIDFNNYFPKINIKTSENYRLNPPVIRNKITGKKHYHEVQKNFNNDEKLYLYEYVFGPLDSKYKDKDYELVLSMKEILDFDTPLKFSFDIDISDKQGNIHTDNH